MFWFCLFGFGVWWVFFLLLEGIVVFVVEGCVEFWGESVWGGDYGWINRCFFFYFEKLCKDNNGRMNILENFFGNIL